MLMAFVIIGSLGLAVALLTLVVGEFDWLPEVDAVPDGALSTTTIAGTFAGFGFGGAAAMSFGVEPVWQLLLIAVLAGLLAWVGSFVIFRSLVRQQEPDGANNIARVAGTTGTVITVPARTSDLGELSLTFLGQPRKMSFQCAHPVTLGQQVVVTTVVSSSQVIVEPKAIEASSE